MGHAHKLRPDIVQFVIDQKKASSGLSCRRLVELVEQQFQAHISKSSVNGILKEAGLNSPVGRRSLPVKKYAIPTQKKSQLFPDIETFGISQESLKPKRKKIRNLQEDDLTPQVFEKPFSLQDGRSSRKKKADKHYKDKPKMSNFQQQSQIGHFRQKILDINFKPGSRGIFCETVGPVLLKAAEWELTGRPIFGHYLRKYIKGIELINVDALSDLLLLMSAFGINRPEDFSAYQGNGLWVLSGIEEKIDARTIQTIFSQIPDINELGLNIAVDLRQKMTFVSRIEINMQNGEKIALDPFFGSIWPEEPQPPFGVPYRMALRTLAHDLISNVHPLVLCTPASAEGFTPEFLSMVRFFEGQEDKKVSSLDLMSHSSEKMVNFTKILMKRRLFICGFWPWQKIFQKLSQLKPGKAINYFCDQSDQRFYYGYTLLPYKEIGIPSLPGKVRLIFLKRESLGEPFLILMTNAGFDEQEDFEVINRYFSAWPYLEEGAYLKKMKAFLSGEESLRDMSGAFGLPWERAFSRAGSVWAVSEALKEALQDHLLRRLSGVGSFKNINHLNSILNVLLSLGGEYWRTNQRVFVHFDARSVAPSDALEIQHVIKLLNEALIRDFDGRIFCVS